MNVFDFAMEVERTGRTYYRNLARKAAAPGVRAIFSMMADDEQELLERFRAMKASTQSTTLEDSRVVESLGNDFAKVFAEGEALAISSDLEAYNYVMKVERDICRLYEGAAARESKPEVKTLLLKIAAEERRELDSLRKVYDFVNAPNEYLAWGEFSNLNEFHNFGREEG